jgi:hypothetical protein
MNVGEIIAACGLFVTLVGAAITIAFMSGKVMSSLDSVIKMIGAVEVEMKRSAESQGSRLEALRDDVGTLMDFKARTEGRAERDREVEMSGVVKR